MRGYVITTGIMFAALASLHVFVVVERGRALAADPWPAIVLVITGALTLWAGRLVRIAPKA